ncbi:MAG: NAD-binding protein [Planctomycetota bacterium]
MRKPTNNWRSWWDIWSVGRTVDRLLREAGLDTVIIDMNTDTVIRATEGPGRAAIYGDASRDTILELAGVAHASHLVLALPHDSAVDHRFHGTTSKPQVEDLRSGSLLRERRR